MNHYGYNQGNYQGNYQDNNKNRVRPGDILMNESLLIQIPSDPTPAEIVEILSKEPAVISYIQNIVAEKQNQVSMKKLVLDKKEKEYERKLSAYRQEALKEYKEQMIEHLKTEAEQIKKLCQETRISRTDAKEILKYQRPEKPTANDLKDAALLKASDFFKNEIYPLKEELISLEKDLDQWKVKYKLFENNFKASQSIKGLLQNEIKF